jgi:predicted alpha/beta hydrolase
VRGGEAARIVAGDGVTLGARVFVPKGEVRAIGVIAPAMAVQQSIYSAFASHLAAHGIAMLTFDYRGLGESAPEHLRGFRGSITDWALYDLTAAIDFARARFGAGLPTFVIGHSTGGQILGMCPRAPTLAGGVLVAAQSGYWKHWSGVSRAWLFLHWHVMPWVARAAGYLPMRAVKQGEDVPLEAALEWARWGRDPRHVLSSPHARHGSLELPLKAYLISDDNYAPPRAVRELCDFYARARVELEELTPADLGTRAIGHFGIFRREFRPTFYAQVTRWILQRAAERVAA